MPRENLKERSFVLIADDSEENSFFMERALRKSGRAHVIGSVRNNEEAIAYLSGQGAYADRQLWPFPNVLLINLKTTPLHGPDVLEWLRRNPRPGLKAVVLPGSPIEMEIQKVKALGESAFSGHEAQLAGLVAAMEGLLLGGQS